VDTLSLVEVLMFVFTFVDVDVLSLKFRFVFRFVDVDVLSFMFRLVFTFVLFIVLADVLLIDWFMVLVETSVLKLLFVAVLVDVF
jgi:hypothetical protein